MVLDNLELSDNMALPDEILYTLPNKLRSTYILWKEGEDLRQSLSKPTFYRHRTQLLSFGIDISVAQETKRNNIVPMIRYLQAEPAGIPVWAYHKGLVA
jgi:II/X family phage/plasmid replication protein